MQVQPAGSWPASLHAARAAWQCAARRARQTGQPARLAAGRREREQARLRAEALAAQRERQALRAALQLAPGRGRARLLPRGSEEDAHLHLALHRARAPPASALHTGVLVQCREWICKGILICLFHALGSTQRNLGLHAAGLSGLLHQKRRLRKSLMRERVHACVGLCMCACAGVCVHACVCVSVCLWQAASCRSAA